MINHIPHTLSRVLSPKTLCFGVCVMLLFSLIPIQFAEAISTEEAIECIGKYAFMPGGTGSLLCFLGQLGLTSVFGNAVVNGIAASVDVVVGIIAAAAKTLAETTAAAMVDTINAFMKIPVSPGSAGTPSAITGAWTTVRNLVNIIFILIVTFIGLATILRLQSYQLQKTLPSLIIVALLVNFSGVLVGFIVDIGSIITKVFLDMGTPGFLGKWTSTDFPGITGAAGLGTHIVSLIYYTISLIIYFVVILLFGVRTLVLWTLAILAPIAFAAYVLPATKKYWTQWFQQLIQWSILGIPISFTLYVSKLVLSSGQLTNWFKNDAFASFFAPLTALFLLFLGITLSMQMAPAGAQKVIAWGQKAGKRAGAWGAREAWRTQGKRIEKYGAGLRKWGQDDAHGNRLTRWGAKNVGKYVELGSKEANIRIKKRDEEAIAKGEKTVKVKGEGIKNYRIEKEKPPGLRDTSQMDGFITGELKIKNKKGIRKAIKNGEISEEDLIKTHKNAVDNGDEETKELLERAFPEYTFDHKMRDKDGNEIKDKDGNTIIGNEFGVNAEDQKERMSDYSQKDVADKILTSDDVLKKDKNGKVIGINEEFVDRLIKEGNHRLIQQILEKGDPEESQALWGYIKKKEGDGGKWLHDNNRDDLINWSRSTAAQGLGIDEIKYTQPEELAKLEERGREAQEKRTRIESEIVQIQAKIDELRKKNKELRDEIQTLRTGTKPRMPGAPAVSRSDREKIEQDEDTIKKSEEQIGVWEKELKEASKDADKLEDDAKKIEKEIQEKKGPSSTPPPTTGGPAAPPTPPPTTPPTPGHSGPPPSPPNIGSRPPGSGSMPSSTGGGRAATTPPSPGLQITNFGRTVYNALQRIKDPRARHILTISDQDFYEELRVGAFTADDQQLLLDISREWRQVWLGTPGAKGNAPYDDDERYDLLNRRINYIADQLNP